VSRPALGSIQPPIQWVPRVLPPGVERGWDVTLTTHPHLVPWSRMSRSDAASPHKQAPPWCAAGQLYFTCKVALIPNVMLLCYHLLNQTVTMQNLHCMSECYTHITVMNIQQKTEEKGNRRHDFLTDSHDLIIKVSMYSITIK
jgi:hypothetical protein